MLDDFSHTYDLHGNPISLRRWAELFEDFDGRVVGDTEVGAYRVSTVWLGLDHSFGHGPPLIFESMVFARGTPYDADCYRYATLEDARAGHEQLVTVLRATTIRTVEDMLADEETAARKGCDD